MSWLRTDIVARAVPWSDLLLREGRLHDELNLRIATRVCVLLAWIAARGCDRQRRRSTAPGVVAAVGAILLTLADLRLWRYFIRLRGVWFTLRAAPLHWLYYLYSGAAFAFAAMRHVASGRARRVEPA